MGLSWLALGLATAGTITALTLADGDVRLALFAATLPFVVRVLIPRFPASAALVITTVFVIVANIDVSVEAAFFLPIIAVLPVVATDPNRFRAYAIGAVALLAAAITRMIGGDDAGDWSWLFWSMGALLMTVVGAVVYRQRALSVELLEARQQLTDQAIAAERRRIARELHDLVGHSLSVCCSMSPALAIYCGETWTRPNAR